MMRMMMQRMRPAAALHEMISSWTSVMVINRVRSDHEHQTEECLTDKREKATISTDWTKQYARDIIETSYSERDF